jgi:hypothetical protein
MLANSYEQKGGSPEAHHRDGAGLGMIRHALLGIALLSTFSAGAQSQVKVERGLKLDADGSIRISNLVGSVRVNRLGS